ncbi:MAG TPA: hypothetical protein VIK60_05985 [Vicinamibacterales bacterium]
MRDVLPALLSERNRGAGRPATSDAAELPLDEGQHLYWSLQGEVACAMHAPEPGSPRWAGERWAEVPATARRRHGREYQCQHCSMSRTPLGHRRRNERVP